ncbi:phage tail protein [Marinomonas primoryensis]|uniref:phage tail-collar fiber domain-containing protein n=1 Tax=Marinomonas primoryensis TaxID=178399 RepID=UPI00370449FB
MAFITIAGQNQIAKKQGDNVTLNIASFVLANVPDLGSEPETRIESIPNENVVDQLVVTRSGYVNTNQVVYSLVMGSDIGNYSFNWVGLVDDEGVLIAVTYIPLTPKTKNDGGVPGNTITRNFLLAYTGIQQTTAITVPAETWQIDFSARLSGIDERERLSNLDIYGHEGFLGDGWKVTGSAGTYSVAAGVGYVGGIRAKNTTAQEITTAIFPNEIWLNVSLQGDISDMTAVSEFVIDTGPFADYVDGNGIAHYITKLAEIDAVGEVVEARVISYLKDIKSIVDKSATGKKLFNVSGDANDIVLTSKAGTTKITELSDYDEFSFIVAATNTAAVTIEVDGLAAMSLASVVSDTQIFETALLTVRYICGAFYIAEQINPKLGSNVLDIAKLYTDTVDILRPGEYALDGSSLSRSDHPIAFAIVSASSNYIDQAAKDADPIEYGGYYGDGDGVNTFTLPMLGGEFIRMFDDGRGIDSSRVFGSWKTDDFKSHSHPSSALGNIDSRSVGGGPSEAATAGSSTGVSGGTETRPRSIAYYGKTRL